MHKVLIFLSIFCLSQGLFGQLDTKPLIDEVGVDEHLGETLDLDLTFVDETGKTVALRELIDGDLPVVIAPVYYSCPNLCTLVLNGVRDLINETSLKLGDQYRVINISIDPTNTPELAAEKAANYYETLNEPESGKANWHYLTGTEENVARVMDQIGFRYKWINDQYSHASVIVLASPEGLITRYIYGVKYNARDFRLAMVEASAGTVGSTLDKVLIYCFKYDPLAGKYVPIARRIMRIGALITLLLLAAFVIFLWSKELLNKRRLGQHV